MIFISLSAKEYTDHEFIRLVKRYEGYSEVPYICPAGYLTIGYGHLWKGSKDTVITREYATQLFLGDFQNAIDDVERVTGNILADEPYYRTLALASFVFNLGIMNFRNSTLLRKVKVKDWQGAYNEFLKWDKATNPKTKKKEPLLGLTRRRKTEALFFLKGEVKEF